MIRAYLCGPLYRKDVRGSSLKGKRKKAGVVVKEKPTKKRVEKIKKKLVVNVRPLIFALRFKKNEKVLQILRESLRKKSEKIQRKIW